MLNAPGPMGARVGHADKEIKGVVGVGHDEEQRRLAVSQGIQLQLVVGRQLPKLRDVKGCQPCAAAHQNRLGCFAD